MSSDFPLAIYVQPGASRPSVGGTFDGELVVKVRERPIDGAATDAVIHAVAEAFELRTRQVVLVRGATSRHKLLRLTGDEVLLSQRAAQLRGEGD